MKTILITMWSILFVQLGLSQKVEVLKSSGKTNLPLAEDFAFIEPKTDTVNYSFVSTYRVVGKKNEGNVTNLFFLISSPLQVLARNPLSPLSGMQGRHSSVSVPTTSSLFSTKRNLLYAKRKLPPAFIKLTDTFRKQSSTFFSRQHLR